MRMWFLFTGILRYLTREFNVLGNLAPSNLFVNFICMHVLENVIYRIPWLLLLSLTIILFSVKPYSLIFIGVFISKLLQSPSHLNVGTHFLLVAFQMNMIFTLLNALLISIFLYFLISLFLSLNAKGAQE